MNFSTAELAYLLAATGDGGAVASAACLGVPNLPIDDPLCRAGVSSLLLRGVARAVGEELQMAPEAVGVAAALAGADRVVSIGVGLTDAVAMTIVVRSPTATLVCTPRAWGIIEFTGAPRESSLDGLLARWAQTAFADAGTVAVGFRSLIPETGRLLVVRTDEGYVLSLPAGREVTASSGGVSDVLMGELLAMA